MNYHTAANEYQEAIEAVRAANWALTTTDHVRNLRADADACRAEGRRKDANKIDNQIRAIYRNDPARRAADQRAQEARQALRAAHHAMYA